MKFEINQLKAGPLREAGFHWCISDVENGNEPHSCFINYEDAERQLSKLTHKQDHPMALQLIQAGNQKVHVYLKSGEIITGTVEFVYDEFVTITSLHANKAFNVKIHVLISQIAAVEVHHAY